MTRTPEHEALREAVIKAARAFYQFRYGPRLSETLACLFVAVRSLMEYERED